MATAKTDTVKKTVEKEVQEEVVTLTMSREEAKVLRAALGCIAGRGLRPTYARDTSKIRNALEAAGVVAHGPNFFEGILNAKPRIDVTSSGLTF